MKISNMMVMDFFHIRIYINVLKIDLGVFINLNLLNPLVGATAMLPVTRELTV